MFELLLFFMATVMIWITWGLGAFLLALAAKVALVMVFKPKYRFDMNWGALIANLVVIVVGVAAVESKWHEPSYTAAAVVISVFLYAMAVKG